MARIHTRRSFAAGLSALVFVVGRARAADAVRAFSIPAGQAVLALCEWSRITDIQVIFDFESLLPYRTRAVVGSFTVLDALGAMLRDTPLTFDIVNPRLVDVMIGTQYCQPWQNPKWAPLPPCMQMPAMLERAEL